MLGQRRRRSPNIETTCLDVGLCYRQLLSITLLYNGGLKPGHYDAGPALN